MGDGCSRPIRSNALIIVRSVRTIGKPSLLRGTHELVGFDVPRDIRSSSTAHLFTRREACSCRRAAVERNSSTSFRSSSNVGLVCATAFIMSHGNSKSESTRNTLLARSILNPIYLKILNLEDTPKHTGPSRLRDREACCLHQLVFFTQFRAGQSDCPTDARCCTQKVG